MNTTLATRFSFWAFVKDNAKEALHMFFSPFEPAPRLNDFLYKGYPIIKIAIPMSAEDYHRTFSELADADPEDMLPYMRYLVFRLRMKDPEKYFEFWSMFLVDYKANLPTGDARLRKLDMLLELTVDEIATLNETKNHKTRRRSAD